MPETKMTMSLKDSIRLLKSFKDILAIYHKKMTSLICSNITLQRNSVVEHIKIQSQCKTSQLLIPVFVSNMTISAQIITIMYIIYSHIVSMSNQKRFNEL